MYFHIYSKLNIQYSPDPDASSRPGQPAQVVDQFRPRHHVQLQDGDCPVRMAELLGRHFGIVERKAQMRIQFDTTGKTSYTKST